MRALLATVAVLLAVAAPAAAACPKTTLGDVEDEVMCPVCGTPLGLATEAPQAQRERELIRRLVDGCKSKDEVKAVLATEFGDEVLALPGGEGFDLAAYLVPALALLLAGGAVGFSALRWRSARAKDQARAEGVAESAGGASEPAEGGDAVPVGDVSTTAPPPGDPRRKAAARLDSDLDRYEL